MKKTTEQLVLSFILGFYISWLIVPLFHSKFPKFDFPEEIGEVESFKSPYYDILRAYKIENKIYFEFIGYKELKSTGEIKPVDSLDLFNAK